MTGGPAATEQASAPGRRRRHGPPVARARPPGDPPETGRARVLSATGRDLTADRWYASEHGPHTALASAAPAPCASCGFLVRLGGPLGRAFGVCANAYAPDDGRVVVPSITAAARTPRRTRPGRPISRAAWPSANSATTWWTRPASRSTRPCSSR